MAPPLFCGNNHLPDWQAEFFPEDLIKEKARESGFLKRMRKLNPAFLLQVLVFGVSCHIKPTFEEIYRIYLDFDDTKFKDGKIRIQSFANRFNVDLGNFLLLMLNYYIGLALEDCPARLIGPVKNLKDILLQDSSIIRLSQKLADLFPAARSRGKAAGLKIHAVYSAVTHSLYSFEITSERVHDSRILKIGKDIKDKLIIFDLAYYSTKAFTKIHKFGGFFVCRVKTNATPKIVEVISSSQSVKKKFKKGMLLKDLLENSPKKGNLDLICEFNVKNPTTEKKTNNDQINFRVVCFWDEESLIWHTYITNLPQEEYTYDEIYQLYEFRWIIELLFKELKGDYNLGHLLLAKNPLAFVHIYSMLIRLVISRNLYKLIIRSVNEQNRYLYGPLLWSKIFAEKGKEFLSILNQEIFGTGSVRYRWEKLESSLRDLARSRHKKYRRLSLKFISF